MPQIIIDKNINKCYNQGMKNIVPNFSDYAKKNYGHLSPDMADAYLGGSFLGTFLRGTSLNSVPGDKLDSVLSPLRARFYSDVATLGAAAGAAAATGIAANQYNAEPSSPLVLGGMVLAVLGVGVGAASLVSGRQARSAIADVHADIMRRHRGSV